MQETKHQPRVVIIGAGIAGISAASRLHESGFTDVIILEASDRIGGRIHTVQFGDGKMPVELGANWIHGPTIKNSVFELADKIGALNPYRLHNRSSAGFMREDGVEIDRELVKDAVHIFTEVMSDLYLLISSENEKSKQRLMLEPVLTQLLNRRIEGMKNRVNYDDMKRVFNAMRNHVRFHNGDELERVTYCKDFEVNVPPGGDVHIPRGYSQILDHLLKKFPKSSILLNSEVIQIKWTGTLQENVEISVRDGQKFAADHVVVTCSLGYLKKHYMSLFEPPLPMQKANAIKSLGIGMVNKIFLEFDRPVTAPTYASIAFAWDDDDIGRDGSMWYKRIYGFDQIFTKENTILGWISGDGAQHMEKLSDNEIADTCVRLLRRFLGDASIPNPKGVLVSRWCTNPYFLGAYVYSTKDMDPQESIKLSAPLVSESGLPKVLFAGEATQNGYTHAARDSGLLVADTLTQLYKTDQMSKL